MEALPSTRSSAPTGPPESCPAGIRTIPPVGAPLRGARATRWKVVLILKTTLDLVPRVRPIHRRRGQTHREKQHRHGLPLSPT